MEDDEDESDTEDGDITMLNTEVTSRILRRCFKRVFRLLTRACSP